MKGKFEDKLAKLAFGELNSDEAARLEREVQSDPEALRTLSMYKDMRSGLRSLSDIPEDQFSKERLRDAILTQGLKPVPTRPVSNRTWLWMPAAACALGFALMYGQGMFRHSAGPKLVINSDQAGLHSTIKSPIEFDPKPTDGSKLVAVNTPKPSASLTKDMLPKVDPDEVDPRILVSVPINDDSYDPDLGKMPENGPSAPSGTLASIEHKPAATSVPIVLIDQDTDQQTGACKATEVGSSSNVLVGG